MIYPPPKEYWDLITNHKGNVWFISDTHFGHKHILKYCNRPFHNIQEHDYFICEMWNKHIQPGDIVFHLGDVAFMRIEFIKKLLKKLNGIKILIRGNHDWSHEKMLWAGFRFSLPRAEYKGYHMVHRPSSISKRDGYKHWLVGHTHENVKVLDLIRAKTRGLNMCVDAWQFRPVSFQEIRQYEGIV